MRAPLDDHEMELLRRAAELQEQDLVDFCIELDVIPDEPFSVDEVIDPLFDALVERAGRDGLPISRYDADDLARFSARELRAFARALGVRAGNGSADATIHAIVKAMRKVPRKLPRRSQLPLLVTYFLPALVRHFARTAPAGGL